MQYWLSYDTIKPRVMRALQIKMKDVQKNKIRRKVRKEIKRKRQCV